MTKAKRPFPPRLWICYFRDLLTDEFEIDARGYRTFDDDKQYLSLEEHTHLLAEAVAKAEREAKAQVWSESVKEIDSWLDLIEADHRAKIKDLAYADTQAASREYGNRVNLLSSVLTIFKQKASELRKGATPENG